MSKIVPSTTLQLRKRFALAKHTNASRYMTYSRLRVVSIAIFTGSKPPGYACAGISSRANASARQAVPNTSGRRSILYKTIDRHSTVTRATATVAISRLVLLTPYAATNQKIGHLIKNVCALGNTAAWKVCSDVNRYGSDSWSALCACSRAPSTAQKIVVPSRTSREAIAYNFIKVGRRAALPNKWIYACQTFRPNRTSGLASCIQTYALRSSSSFLKIRVLYI